MGKYCAAVLGLALATSLPVSARAQFAVEPDPSEGVAEPEAPAAVEAEAPPVEAAIDEWLPRHAKAGAPVHFYHSGHGAPDPKSGDS